MSCWLSDQFVGMRVVAAFDLDIRQTQEPECNIEFRFEQYHACTFHPRAAAAIQSKSRF
jgi:hypothetical protein